MKENGDACALCSSPIGSHPIIDDVRAFCCAGCHAVFNILSAKNQLSGYQDHPLFLEALKSGLIANPALLENLSTRKKELAGLEREKLYLEITGMWCPSCGDIIRLLLMKEEGVISCVVDYSTDLAAIEFTPQKVSKECLMGLICKLGYEPRSLEDSGHRAVSRDLYLRFGIAAFCALNIMMLAYPLYATYFEYDGEGYGSLFAWLSLLLSLPVIFYSGWPIWRRFANSLATGIFGMETLVFIGVAASLGVSLVELYRGETRVYFDSMTVIIAFVLLGKIVEARAKFSSKECVMRLSRSSPQRGRKRNSDGTVAYVLLKEMAKGETLVVHAGERIPLDGVVIDGEGTCDESLMTGESIPIRKRPKDAVLAGSILVQGYLIIQVTGTETETALRRIIDIVERDIGHKSTYVRAADQIVRWFVPTVLFLAAMTAAWWLWMPRIGSVHPFNEAWLTALAVLLISCPCAIGIAAPTAESYLLNALAAAGVIIRNRACLRNLGKETLFVFDKTGTVTEGRYQVIEGLAVLLPEQQAALASLASRSSHPVACAVSRSISEAVSYPVREFEEVTGYGLRGIVAGLPYALGSKRFMEQMGIAIPASLDRNGLNAVIYVAKGSKCLTQLVLGDQIRSGICDLIAALKPSKTFLLSGDSEAAVSTVAKMCGIDGWQSEYTPLEKRDQIDRLKEEGHIVCMVGDGINDAPALTAAHVGVSAVSATDMSIQVSDVLLTTDAPNALIKMRVLAKKGRVIIRQNLFWAFFYNVIGIFLAMCGMLSPIFAAFAMSVSSITVLLNAQRIKNLFKI